MIKFIKRILLIFVIIFSSIILFENNQVSAKTLNTSDLEFTLTRVIELKDYKYISIEVTNSSSTTTYSFGWVSSCKINVETTEGTYSKTISSGKIEQGSKTYNYMLEAPGDIESVYYTDIRELNSNGLPISESVGSYVSTDISVAIDDYNQIDGIKIIAIAAITLIALIIVIKMLSKKNRSAVRTIGKIVFVAGIVTLIYAGYCFAVKPTLDQADFMDVARKYWFLWIIGMVVVVIGQCMKNSGKKSHYSNSSNSGFNAHNQFMQQEQQRLFNEQMQRDMQDHQRFMDETNQQQFNDFMNNQNSNNMF